MGFPIFHEVSSQIDRMRLVLERVRPRLEWTQENTGYAVHFLEQILVLEVSCQLLASALPEVGLLQQFGPLVIERIEQAIAAMHSIMQANWQVIGELAIWLEGQI